MWWVFGYIAMLAYAGAAFTYAATRERWFAAIGTLLSVSGLQLGVMQTLDPAVAVALVVLGVGLVSRDVALVVSHRLTVRPAAARVTSRSHFRAH